MPGVYVYGTTDYYRIVLVALLGMHFFDRVIANQRNFYEDIYAASSHVLFYEEKALECFDT